MSIHKIFILLTFISFIVLTNNADPELYKCSNQLVSDTCFLKGKDGPADNRVAVNYVKPCPVGQICIISGDYGVCADVQKKVPAGGECKSSAECKRGFCTNNICTPIEDGKTCEEDKDCRGGSVCSSQKCKKQNDVNGDCSRDLECKIGLICSGNKCTRFASIPDGEIISHS